MHCYYNIKSSETLLLRLRSVQETTTTATTTQTYNLLILDGEMVVVRNLVTLVDGLFGEYDNLLARPDRKDSGCTVWRAAVIDQSTEIALHCRIDDHIVIHTAADRRISSLSCDFSRPTHNR